MFDSLLKRNAHVYKSNRNVENEELLPLLNEGFCDENGFITIGKVDRFVIYPIDCGLGFKFKSAIFTANGIQMIGVEKKYMVDDRTLIVYNKATKEALVDPKFTMTAKKEEILLYCLGELFKQRYQDLEVIQVNYLGTEVPLRIFASDSPFEKEIQNKVFKKHKKNLLGLGYCTNEDRRLLNENHRFRPSEPNNLTDDEMKMAFLPNFSHYTLINTASYNKCILNGKKKKENSPNFRNFRPQIIIKFNSPFAEDNIEEIKIKDYIFQRVIPCVTEATNYNPKCSEKKFVKVYQRLESERTLFNIYPRFAKAKNPILPIFGINMELKQDSKAAAPLNTVINRGDEVSVKYFTSACLNSPDAVASTSKSVSTSVFKPDFIPASTSTTVPTTVSISTPPTSCPTNTIPDSGLVSAAEYASDIDRPSTSASSAVKTSNIIADSPSSNSPDAVAVEPGSDLAYASISSIDCPINVITDSESNSADASTTESAPDSAYASISATSANASASSATSVNASAAGATSDNDPAASATSANDSPATATSVNDPADSPTSVNASAASSTSVDK